MIFGKRTRNLEMEVAYLQADIKTHNDRYWALYHKYALILDYLGVVEVAQPSKVLLRERGGPEQSE